MKKRHPVWLAAILMTQFLAACGQSGASFDVSLHATEILEWREWRIERLKMPSGYLNQIGIFWLEPGSYRFGSAATNEVVFGGDAPAEIGVFIVTDSGVSMRVNSGVDVRSEGEPVAEIDVLADTTDSPVTLSLGSLSWAVVERDGRYAVRLRDFEHPFVATFGPLPYFDIAPELRVEAKLIRYAEPRIANVGTVIEGLGYHPESPGVVEFEIDGTAYELEAYTSGDELFYVFGDLSNRDATYGAGRFMYSATPGDDGITVLDFNKAYSPPCAFNDFSTCPVASPRNRLPIRIEAGEKFDLEFHYAAEN